MRIAREEVIDVDEDLNAVDIHRLGDAIAETSAHIDLAKHRLLEMLRVFDQREGWAGYGAKSAAHWLSWRTGLLPGAARERVRVARALGELPGIDAALRRGVVSYSKVRAMTRVATAENEETLLEMAGHATASELEKICRGLGAVQEAGAARQAGEEVAKRWVRHRRTDDGMVRIEAQLTADEAEMVLKALAEARKPPEKEADQEGDQEAEQKPGGIGVPAGTPMGARQADALVRIADSFVATGSEHGVEGNGAATGAERTQLFVHLSEQRLDPDGPLEATLQDGTTLSPQALLRLACDCKLVPVRTGEGGQILDVGRQTRSTPRRLRRAVMARDRKCCFPGCDNVAFLDTHHIEHWAQGGETTLANLVLLCRHHHVAVHERGFGLERKGDGTLRFFTPDGAAIEEVPAQPGAGRGVPAETLERMRADVAARGLALDLHGHEGSFRMEPIEYGWAIESLLPAELRPGGMMG